MLQFEIKSVAELRSQLKKLQEELTTLKGLQTLLASSTAEVKKVLDSEKDPRILASWVEALKRLNFYIHTLFINNFFILIQFLTLIYIKLTILIQFL